MELILYLGKFVGSQLFSNIILFVSASLVFIVGLRQIKIRDVVEIYATADFRPNKLDGETESYTPVVFLQNVGTRLLYLDKYIFNGSVYKKGGHVLPSTYSQARDPFYWIELPTNGAQHVSLEIFYHDLEGRKWRTDLAIDAIPTDESHVFWEVKISPRVTDK